MQPPWEGNYCASYEWLHVNVCSSCCQQQVSTHLTYQAFYSLSFICFHHPLPCALVFINGSGVFLFVLVFFFSFFFILFFKRPEFMSLMEHLGGGHSSYLLHFHSLWWLEGDHLEDVVSEPFPYSRIWVGPGFLLWSQIKWTIPLLIKLGAPLPLA